MDALTSGASRLAYVGIDDVVGCVTSLEGLEMERASTVSPDGLEELGDPFLLDVRARAENEASHIPGANQLHGGRVMWHLDEQPEGG